MKIKELKAISEPKEYYEAIEARIIELFKREIYVPLILDLNGKKSTLQNTYDDLINAISNGKIQYVNGHFEGAFNATISRELKELGATWNKLKGWWVIPKSKLTADMSSAIGVSVSRFKKMAERVNSRLEKISPKEIADKLQIEHLFDAAIYKVNKEFEENVKNLTITPTLTPEQRKRISEEYVKNMQLYIQEWTEKEIIELRNRIAKNAYEGYRYESMVKTIKDSYGVSQNKAKFLARQETSLMVTKFAQTRYQDAGSNEYIWQCVAGSPAHPVRPMHKALNGKTFNWNTPPIVNEKGERKNPGQDYGCRCKARPIVRF